MVFSFKKIFLFGLVSVLLFVGCSNNKTTHQSTISNSFKPNPYDDSVNTISTSARPSGSAFLINLKEMGVFDRAGRITCLVIDKSNTNRLIAGAATGGIWLSENRGYTWKPVDDHLPTLHIRSLNQNPFQTNIIYASTQTTMTGTSGPTAQRPDIYKSTDGGHTFQLLPETAGNFTLVGRVVCSPIQPNVVYALSYATNGRGVYRSVDNGATFTQVFAINHVADDLEVLPNGTVLVSGGSNVYRSTNGNPGTFVLSNAGLNGPNTFDHIELAFSSGHPNSVYGVSTGGNSGVGVFKSTNGGQSWTFLQTLVSGVFTRAIGVKPDNPNFILGGSVGLTLSQNGGSSFVAYPVGGVDYWSVNFDPVDPNKVIITFDQGISEVNLSPFNPDPYSAYVKKDSLLNCSQIYAGDFHLTDERVIFGLQDLGTKLIRDGKVSNVGGNDGGYCFFHKQDTTVVYLSYQNGRILKKNNLHIPFPQPGFQNPVSILNQLDADNNSFIDEGYVWIHPFWMNNANGQQLFLPTKKRLWRSNDGGDNWQPISAFYEMGNSNTIEILGNNKDNPIVYWITADTLRVLPNAGTVQVGNELKIKIPGIASSLTIHPNNDSFVFITNLTAGQNKIIKSSNIFKGNVQWTDITGDLETRQGATAFAIDPLDSNQMIAGTFHGLFTSSDGGQHWEKELQFPNVNVRKLLFRESDHRIFIFTYGRGAWAANFPSKQVGVKRIDKSTTLSIWPNPTKDVVHVAVPDIKGRDVSLKLFSLDGKLLHTLPNLQHTPAAVSLANLPTGTYIIALYNDGKQIASSKILKQ